MKLLAFDLTFATATSVCLFEDGRVKKFRALRDIKPVSSKIPELIKELLEDADLMCISRGPGSFTALRIGISYVKGIWYAKRLPIFSGLSLEWLSRCFFEISCEDKVVVAIKTGVKNLYYFGTFRRDRMEDDVRLGVWDEIESKGLPIFAPNDSFITTGAIWLGKLYFEGKLREEDVPSLEPVYIFGPVPD